jgi:group I intron endonuclease
MEYIVYKITNKVNNKIYIGLTNNFQKRKQGHLSDCFNEKSKRYNHLIYRAIRKYGLENFQWDILKTYPDRKSMELGEKYYIAYYESNNKNNGYNCTIGGDGGPIRLGMKTSEETKKKISLSCKGKVISEEQKKQISETLKGRKPSNNTIIANSRPIKNIVTGEMFISVKEAYEKDQVSKSTIFRILNGKQDKDYKHNYVYQYM